MNMPFIRSFPIVMRLSEEENVTENLKATAPYGMGQTEQ